LQFSLIISETVVKMLGGTAPSIVGRGQLPLLPPPFPVPIPSPFSRLCGGKLDVQQHEEKSVMEKAGNRSLQGYGRHQLYKSDFIDYIVTVINLKDRADSINLKL